MQQFLNLLLATGYLNQQLGSLLVPVGSCVIGTIVGCFHTCLSGIGTRHCYQIFLYAQYLGCASWLNRDT